MAWSAGKIRLLIFLDRLSSAEISARTAFRGPGSFKVLASDTAASIRAAKPLELSSLILAVIQTAMAWSSSTRWGEIQSSAFTLCFLQNRSKFWRA